MDKTENLSTIPDQKSIDAEAADWLVRLEEDQVPPEDRAAFLAWRGASARHRDAFDRLAVLWGDFDHAKVLADYAASDENAELLAKDARDARFSAFSRRTASLGLAASVVLFVGAGVLIGTQGRFFSPPRAEVEAALADASAPLLPGGATNEIGASAAFETAIGEQRTINLPDGSIIELNTNSRVEYAYAPDAREIKLMRGEAFFDVAPDKSRPFTVATTSGNVVAVGTSFTVRLDKNKVGVVVSEGDVVFLTQKYLTAQAARREKSAPLPDEATAISAGQTAEFKESAERIDFIEPDAMARKLSWRHGVLAFSGDPLSDVVADVSRYTDVVIEIDDEMLRGLPVSGYFKIGEVDEMFEALELMAGLQAERIGAKKVRLIKLAERG
ncbi:MAG: FecR domain-containing protein [Amphiplicatus sp.]